MPSPPTPRPRPSSAELNRICRPDGDWDCGERVIVFTEYKATQQWLAGILTARGLGGDRLGLLFGGMDENKREHLKAAFQAGLDRDPVRILLATDAASEGIDLQRHCHRVIHYDIPFNPNRLEQRIGRVDRHGQTHEVEVSHFVGAGWDKEPEGSYAGDLEYLSRVARKVATERQDLGSVNPVLAHAVEARMLGRPKLIDPLQVTPKASTSLLRAERDLRDQVRKLHDQLDASIRELHVAPANVRRVVDTALALADQPPLADEPDGLIAPPALRAGWERTVTGLADPLDGHLRPLTFDAKVAEGRDDVVLAHLEYPLVAQATRLLRSAIWGGRAALNRVAALKFTPPADAGVNGPLVAVFARLVLVGADGRRLHEEIMLSARIVPPTGRSRRVELEERRHEALYAAVEAALEPDACRLAPEAARLDFADRWSELEPLLAGDVEQRAKERKERLQRTLDQREATEQRNVDTVFTQLKANLDSALDGPGAVQLTFDQLDELEKHAYDRDRQAWVARRDGLAEEKQRELDAIRRRYENVRELVFPFAVALCVPEDRVSRMRWPNESAGCQRGGPQAPRVAGAAPDLRAVPHAARGTPGLPQRAAGSARPAARGRPRARRADDGRPRREQARGHHEHAARRLRLAAAPRHRRRRAADPRRDRGGPRGHAPPGLRLLRRGRGRRRLRTRTPSMRTAPTYRIHPKMRSRRTTETPKATTLRLAVEARAAGRGSCSGMVTAWGTHPLTRTTTGTWTANAVERLAVLLRARDVPVGIVTDGRWWALVTAPRGAATGAAVWDASLFSEEPKSLEGLVALLTRSRFQAAQPKDKLPALFAESLERQEEVTEQLGRQVREAVELLVTTLDQLDRESNGTLLAGVSDDDFYAGVVTMMMRVVFLLFAEERRLLPSDDDLYVTAYSVGHLVEQLEQADSLGAVLGQRTAAWHRLLAVTRAVHSGVAHEDLRLPAYGGGLFDPDRYPWLEGRPDAGTPAAAARPPAVDDRTVLRMLRAVQYVVIGGERRRLTFRALDVEQIGYVYEGLLELEVRTATETVLGLARPSKWPQKIKEDAEDHASPAPPT